MTFSKEQIDALKAPLNASHVRQRAQAGRQLSYVEGWHAIAEANRIFGFDQWNRELVTLRELGEARQVGDKWRVAYMATVRIEVWADTTRIARDGTGYGSGIDKDLGSAHESAIKEAETDAMKRALMTFGNPFGLALYDKEQRNVVDDATAYVSLAKTALANASTVEELDEWWRSEAANRSQYGIVKGTPLYAELVAAFSEHKTTLKEAA